MALLLACKAVKTGGSVRTTGALTYPPRSALEPEHDLAGASLVRESSPEPRRAIPAAAATSGGPAPTSRLSYRARAAIRLRHSSPRTEDAHLGWMRRFYEYHGRRDPAELGEQHVTAFLNDLATRGHVAASTQNQALAALLFLYREVLRIDLPLRCGSSRWDRPSRGLSRRTRSEP